MFDQKGDSNDRPNVGPCPFEVPRNRNHSPIIVYVTKRESSFTLAFEIGSTANLTDLSVVMPVFNQASRVLDVLNSLTEMVTTDFELIVIDDASEDSTLQSLLSWATDLDLSSHRHLKRLQVFHSVNQEFETACDSFGFSLCLSGYILEMQADMVITERGFEKKFISAFSIIDNLVAVSGRGVESFTSALSQMIGKGGTTVSRGSSPLAHALSTLAKSLLRLAKVDLVVNVLRRNQELHSSIPRSESSTKAFPLAAEFKLTKSAGRLGSMINENRTLDASSNFIWTGETIMRGPILFHAERLQLLGGLDTAAFFLGYDDHDFCLRAAYGGWRVGYVPIGFESPEEWGSTRKARTLQSEWAIIRERFRVAKSFKGSQAYSSRTLGEYPIVAIERVAID